MSRKSIATALKFGAVVFLLFVFLFADGIGATWPGFISSFLREITAVCRDASTQWMLVLCLACYFIMFLILERRLHGSQRTGDRGRIRLFCGNMFNPDLWLAALVLLSLLPYALAYAAALRSLQIPILITGIVFGKAIATWARSRRDEIERRVVFLIRSLVCLLAVSALWQSERVTVFQYHGIPRWSGVWDNPNLYGLLMGVGVVLAVGLLTSNIEHLSPRGIAASIPQGNSNIQWRKILCVLLCSFAAILTGYGVFKSYSRGAWLAVFAGLMYLIAKAESGKRKAESSCSSRFKKNWLPLSVVLASVFVLAFWQFRFSELRPAQRLFSAANANDFSWRNRVTAWEGAVRMMIDRPWTGFGWGQAETDYNKKYLSSRLNEGAAIEMNDYLMIGISAGVPAMICFAAYIWLSLKSKYTSPHPDPLPSLLERRGDVQATCRAGAIVLLVGFWFDGGLFKLPIATVFWTLMELARIESSVGDEVTSLTSKIGNRSEPPYVVSCSKKEIWLRWLAGILAVLAVAQTTVYLGTPFLPVNDGTLAVARKCLIQRNEVKDFEFLSANAAWRGKKLKVLLEHVRLANYNRELINWKLDDKMYQNFVLSPVLTGDSNEQLNWRRLLWEEFYPRTRHESSPEDAAKIVMKHLRERVTIATLPNPPQDVPGIWLKQITDATGFEIIYVAALRSVGVPARLDSNNHAEFWDGNKWQIAPGLALP